MAVGGKRSPFLRKVRRRTNIVLGLSAALFAATLVFYFFSAWDNLAILNIVGWHLLHPVVLPLVLWGVFMASQNIMLAVTGLSVVLLFVEFIYIVIRFIDWFDCDDVPACDVNFGPFIISLFVAIAMAIHLALIAWFSWGLRALFRCSIPRDNGVRLCAADMVGSPLLKGSEDDALDLAHHFGLAHDSQSGHYRAQQPTASAANYYNEVSNAPVTSSFDSRGATMSGFQIPV